MTSTTTASDRQPGTRPYLTIVSNADLVVPLLPAVLLTLPRLPERRRTGQPGRRRHALLIDAALPDADDEAAVLPALAQALRGLGHQVSVCPVDGVVASSGDRLHGSPLAQAGAACLGLPTYRSVEEVLRRHADAFDIVVLQGAAVGRAYEPLVRLHCRQARILFGAQPSDPGATLLRAAHACDATLAPSDHHAQALRAALPGCTIHVVPLASADVPAIRTALHPALHPPPGRVQAAL